MSFNEKKQQLNALMTEYSQLKENPASRGRCVAIKNQVANIIYSSDFFDTLKRKVAFKIKGIRMSFEPDEYITETFLRCFEKYDYTMGKSFYWFFIDHLEYMIGSELGKKKKKKNQPKRIESTIEDDEGNTTDIVDIIPDPTANPGTIIDISTLGGRTPEPISEEKAETQLRFLLYLSKLIPCIIQSKEHRGNRDKFYRAFATDFYVSSCKEKLHLKYELNENEAFHVMDLCFADSTMKNKCRNFSDFEITPCKTYEEIGLSGRTYSDREIETPFKNGVYSIYFNVTDGLISQRRNSFKKDIGILVGEELLE